MSDENKAAPPVVAGEHDDLIRHLRAAEFSMNYIGNPSRAQIFKEAADGLAAMQARVSELECELTRAERAYTHEASDLNDAQARIAALEEALGWVKQVHPKRLPHGCVCVEITREEFEAMRAALNGGENV